MLITSYKNGYLQKVDQVFDVHIDTIHWSSIPDLTSMSSHVVFLGWLNMGTDVEQRGVLTRTWKSTLLCGFA